MDKRLMTELGTLHPGSIPHPFGDVFWADTGVDAVWLFLQEYGGQTVYIPKLKTVFGGCAELEMRKLYDGRNCDVLVKKFGYSESHIRRVVRNK